MVSAVALLCLALASTQLTAQQISWTPEIPGNLVRVSVDVSPRFARLGLVAGTHDLFVPPGWTARIFYAGQELKKPRFLAWGPDSVLYVANMSGSTVLAFPDLDRDGLADTCIVATKVPGSTSSITFYRDTLFAGSESGITKYWRSKATGYVFDKSTVIVDKTQQPNQLGGNHKTRTVVADTNNYYLYLSVGSRGNADREADRALIERYNWDGSGRKVIATGVRNAVGLTLHPRTGTVWANNNGSDQQGNNIPPEFIDIVRDGGFYGYPFAYHDHNWMDLTHSAYKDILPVTANDSAAVASMVKAAALITAHSAPMQMQFAHDGMPENYRNGLFVALRGSWNRTPVSGTKVVFLTFDGDADTVANSVQDFCTNFILDSTKSDSRWARPVGLALAADGSVFITSDDVKQFIVKLTPPQTSSVQDTWNNSDLRISPNPAGTLLHIASPIKIEQIVSIFSYVGTLVLRSVINSDGDINISGLPAGHYVVISQSGGQIRRAILSVVR